MKLEEGKRIAEAFKGKVKGQCHQIEIVGSIRRGRPVINDVDIVSIPRDPRTFLCGLRALMRGQQIIRFEEGGAKIDLYLATPETFEVLRLIRTGSAQHNVKLATIAKRRGWQLKFGEGLITPEGTVTSERGILEKVLGRYVPPEERE